MCIRDRCISYTYDNNGNLLTAANPEGGVVSYTYDAANRQVSVTDEEGRTEQLEYDGVGRLVKEMCIRDRASAVKRFPG